MSAKTPRFQHIVATIVDPEFLIRQGEAVVAGQARMILGQSKKKIRWNAYRVNPNPLSVDFFVAQYEGDPHPVAVARVEFRGVDFSRGVIGT